MKECKKCDLFNFEDDLDNCPVCNKRLTVDKEVMTR